MAGPNLHFLHLFHIVVASRSSSIMGYHCVPELQRPFPADSMPLVRPSTLHQSRRTGHRPLSTYAHPCLDFRSYLLLWV